jgi:hypothetical protein
MNTQKAISNLESESKERSKIQSYVFYMLNTDHTETRALNRQLIPATGRHSGRRWGLRRISYFVLATKAPLQETSDLSYAAVLNGSLASRYYTRFGDCLA